MKAFICCAKYWLTACLTLFIPLISSAHGTAEVFQRYHNVLAPYFIDHQTPRTEAFIPAEVLLPILLPHLTLEAAPYFTQVFRAMYAKQVLEIFHHTFDSEGKAEAIRIANDSSLCMIYEITVATTKLPPPEKTRSQLYWLGDKFYNPAHLAILRKARAALLHLGDETLTQAKSEAKLAREFYAQTRTFAKGSSDWLSALAAGREHAGQSKQLLIKFKAIQQDRDLFLVLKRFPKEHLID